MEEKPIRALRNSTLNSIHFTRMPVPGTVEQYNKQNSSFKDNV